MPTLFWDIESRSGVNLTLAGAWVYAASISTEPVCICWAIDDGDVATWLPPEPAPAHFLAVARDPGDWKMVAHNWEFERAMLELVLIPRYRFQPIALEAQHCSQQLALGSAFPAELGLLAEALGLPYRKDPAATRAMRDISRPRKPNRGEDRTVLHWDVDPVKHALVRERCRLDVITTRAVWQSPKLKHPSETERPYQIIDARINSRGVLADRKFVTAARDLAVRERIAINLKLQELTDGGITSVDQVQRFLAAINVRGHHMASLNKRAVAAVLASKPDDYVQRLLELRRAGARAGVRKFERILAYAGPDDRIRGTLRMYGGGPGRWAGLGPQLQNLKKNESKLPLTVVDSIRNGDRSHLAEFGKPLALLGDVSRAALCAGSGNELLSADYGAIESRTLAWLAGELWKIDAYRAFDATGDKALEPYRVIAAQMLRKNSYAVTTDDRQLGKGAELASGFGGSIGAWRRIVPGDTRSDAEIKVIIVQWRQAHPATRKFWGDLARAIRIATRTGQPVLVAPAPQPPLIASFEGGNLHLTLPSGRRITYPEARLIPPKFEGAPPDVGFKDNAHKQWSDYRGWFGTFVENVVQGVARDLLAAALERFEARGIAIVFHCHDDVVAEVPAGSITEAEFLAIMLEAPAWATGLPLAGKVRSGQHYLEPPDEPAVPKPAADVDAVILENAIDAYIDDARDTEITDAEQLEREDAKDYVAELEDTAAPLADLVSLPVTADNKVCCPFHEDAEPSCAICADHFYCYGCGERGDRLDWLTRAEGMTRDEAVARIQDWDGSPARRSAVATDDKADKITRALKLWNAAVPFAGTLGERYLAETRRIGLSKLPPDIQASLRFHADCPFGPGTARPCLIALMRDASTDAPIGIQRIGLELRNNRVEKISRMALGLMGVVKLWAAGEQLVVGEGLETVLAAATRIPYAGAPLTPAWAALSSGMLRALPVIPTVTRLILLVDNDANGEGQNAAACSQQRWQAAGRTVIRLTPKRAGTDFNDVVMERAA
jgi:hypothetical protein